MEDLVFLVGLQPLGLKDPVLRFQVKERPGADTDDQGVFQIIGHTVTSSVGFCHYTTGIKGL